MPSTSLMRLGREPVTTLSVSAVLRLSWDDRAVVRPVAPGPRAHQSPGEQGADDEYDQAAAEHGAAIEQTNLVLRPRAGAGDRV